MEKGADRVNRTRRWLRVLPPKKNTRRSIIILAVGGVTSELSIRGQAGGEKNTTIKKIVEPAARKTRTCRDSDFGNEVGEKKKRRRSRRRREESYQKSCNNGGEETITLRTARTTLGGLGKGGLAFWWSSADQGTKDQKSETGRVCWMGLASVFVARLANVGYERRIGQRC